MTNLNTIAFASVIQKALDQKAVHDMLTGWMDNNAGQVIYNGGNEVKIPKLSTDGLANYKRNDGTGAGYTMGTATFSYETRTMTQDRGRKFQIDAMDVDETNFVLTATQLMDNFQREKVIPEVDAYRLSKIASEAIGVGDTNAEYEYTVAAATVVEKIKKGIKVIRENEYQGQLVIQANYDTANAVEMFMAGRIQNTEFVSGGFNTQCPMIDNCPIIPTPQNRLYSAITLYDGTTLGQTAGGYVKGSSALDVNFLIIPVDVPVAVTKQDQMRIFDPMTNQNANAWAMDYRRYHDVWVKDNAKNLVFANIKDKKPTTSSSTV